MYEYRLESKSGNLAGTILPFLQDGEWQYEATPVTQWNGEPDDNACIWLWSFDEAKRYIYQEYSAGCQSYAEGLQEDLPSFTPDFEPTPRQRQQMDTIASVWADVTEVVTEGKFDARMVGKAGWYNPRIP